MKIIIIIITIMIITLIIIVFDFFNFPEKNANQSMYDLFPY